MAAEHLVQHHAQAVDVGAAVDAVRRAGDLLRRHIRRSAGDDAEIGTVRTRVVEAEPEVYEDGAAVRRDDDVRRLDIAVEDEPGVGVGQRIGQSRRDPGRLRPVRAVIPQPPAEIGAFEEVRDDVDLSPVQADVVDRHDAGVAQPREPAGLLEEPLCLGLRHLGAAAEDLDGHGPVELRVVAQVHRAEAAGPQDVAHLVTAEGSRRGRGVPPSSPARPADRGVRSVVRSDSLPGSGLPKAGLRSAESDCTATSPEGSSRWGLPVGCKVVSSSRVRPATAPIARMDG